MGSSAEGEAEGGCRMGVSGPHTGLPWLERAGQGEVGQETDRWQGTLSAGDAGPGVGALTARCIP